MRSLEPKAGGFPLSIPLSIPLIIPLIIPLSIPADLPFPVISLLRRRGLGVCPTGAGGGHPKVLVRRSRVVLPISAMVWLEVR